MHRTLESAPDRHRPPRQREDDPAPSHRGGGAPGCGVGGRFLPRGLRGGELRGRHRRGVLAGMSLPLGGPGASPGRRPGPATHLRGAADRSRRPGACRSLPRRAARLLGPRGQAARADGREPEHAVPGHGGRRRGMAAAQGPPDRTANRPARERNEPIRRDRRPEACPVRPLLGPDAASLSTQASAPRCGRRSPAGVRSGGPFVRSRSSPAAALDWSRSWPASERSCPFAS